MATTGPIREMQKRKLERLEKCYADLENYKNNKMNLQYPTFFIPGWTGENCAAWKEPYKNIPKRYKEYYCPAKHWTDNIIENNEQAYYIEFTEEESKSSPSFMELGRHLKRRTGQHRLILNQPKKIQVLI